jgi:hypothetical protein
MGKYDSIDTGLRAFIEAQHMFFVATAPASAGHVNLSPKGLDTLRVVSSHEIAYLDHVGSGAETIAHLRENGRIVLMLCAFEGPPKIIRLHGRGDVIEPGDRGYNDFRVMFPPTPEGRAIIRVTVERISDSCGFGVPLYSYEGQRGQLENWAERKGQQALVDYQRDKNRTSIDGLPALKWTEATTP